MRKTLDMNKLAERSTGRTLLAFSLAASLAAFGCTTNRTPGNGEPVGTAPTGPAATSGSSSGQSAPGNPPMMSSSTHLDPLPEVTTRTTRRLPLTPDEAAAIVAGNQLHRTARVLGPSNPGQSSAQSLTGGVATGGYQDPVHRLGTGIVTVNSSVNSVAHLPALADGGGVVVGGVSGVTGASTITGTTAVTSATTGVTAPVTAAGVTTGTGVGNGGPVVFTPSATAVTPTTAALPFTAGAFSAGPSATNGTLPGTTAATANTGTLTPTVSSSRVPSPTTATSAAITAANRGTARTTATARTTSNRTATAAVAPVRVTQDANGRVIVTNGTRTTTAKQQQ